MKHIIFFLLTSLLFIANAQKRTSSTLQFAYGYGLEWNAWLKNDYLPSNYPLSLVSQQLQLEYTLPLSKHFWLKTGTYLGKSNYDFRLDCPVGEPFSRYTGNSYSMSIPFMFNTFYHIKEKHTWNYFTNIGILYNYSYLKSFHNYPWMGDNNPAIKQKSAITMKEGQQFCWGIEIGLRRWFLKDYFGGISLNRFSAFTYTNSHFARTYMSVFLGKRLVRNFD